jgi:hypothetical protein
METMQFMRGDGADHTFAIPTSSWTAGGRLFFAAKQTIDDDTTDAAAIIAGSWGDEAVSDITVSGVAYKQYACHFSDVADDVESNGATDLELLGEFQFVPLGGADPTTFPGPGQDRIPVSLSFDVKRKTTV